WSVHRYLTSRDVNMAIVAREPHRVEAELDRARAHPRVRSGGRFLHDLAELACDRQPSLPRVGRRLDEEDVSADRRDGEAGGDAGLGSALSHLAGEASRAEPLAGPLLVDP